MLLATLTPFQNTLGCPHLNMTKMEKNRMIQTNIIKLENKITWISPKISLGRKMTHNKAHSLHTSEDGFIIRPSYMDIHISYVLHIVIGKLRT